MDVSRGGGVLLGFHNRLSSQLLDLSHISSVVPNIDFLGCRLALNYFVFYVFIVYIPPSITSAEAETFFELLSSLDIMLHKNLILLGDFNIPFSASVPISSKHKSLLNFSEFLSLNQFNTIPNCNNRLLDLIFANITVDVARNVAPLVEEDSHHPALIFKFSAALPHAENFPVNSANFNQPQYNFRKADYRRLYELMLNTDWSPVIESSDVVDACKYFYGILDDNFSACVPRKLARQRRFPPWFTRELIDIILKKEKVRRHLQVQESAYYLERFKSLRRSIKLRAQQDYRAFVRNAESDVGRNPSNFWSFIQSKKAQSRIPAAMIYDNRHFHRPKNIVSAFADYFKSVYKNSEPSQLPTNSGLSETIGIPMITSEDVISACKMLKDKATFGPDGIPSFLVKDCAFVMSAPLCHIYKLILRNGVFPEIWKCAKICPILKKGDPSLVENYRGISILCNFSKVFEIILHKHLYTKIKNGLSIYQHGFYSKRSCMTNLCSFSAYVCDALNNRRQVDVIYTDFRKAFDQIDHHILLQKASDQFGFSNELISVLKSYLIDRRQFVVIEEHRSDLFVPTSGVPQGSNLGPLLFNIFINDLVSLSDCNRVAYADDLKVFNRIDAVADCAALQATIDTISQWCEANRLHLNTSKCNVVSYSRKPNTIHFEYVIGDTTLERLSTVRDLGVVFDERFSFVPHIDQMVACASRTLGFILRNCRPFSNVATFKLLYCSYVRSKLDYGAVVWSPIYDCHRRSVESVQRRFLKYLMFREDGAYPQRGLEHAHILRRFGELPLTVRRDSQSLLFLHKLLNSKIDCPCLLAQLSFHVPRIGARYQPTFVCELARSNILLQCPVWRMCSTFNRISALCDINYDSFPTVLQRLLEVSGYLR